jgi:putative ABC transport system permease protein
MIRYFSKIALRYLWHNKTYSILNYICLSFGFSCAIIAVLYILNMFSYDKFNKNYSSLYSVEAMVTYFNGDQFPKEYLSASLPEVLKKSAPEIQDITRVSEHNYDFENGDRKFSLAGIYADDNFFDVFTFPFIRGSFSTAGHAADINSIAVSEVMAMKLFENIDCVGKTVAIKDGGNERVFKITGIFKKVPAQSTLEFDFVIPFSRFLSDNPWAYETGATANLTWILLKSENDRKVVNDKIKNLISNQEISKNQELFLFPLSEKVLYRYTGKGRVWTEMQRLVIVAAVGLVILLIACFNFINMAIALNIRRFRETGIKKVVGSRKSIIIYQFLGETFVIILAGLLTAIFLVNLVLPVLNTVLNNEMHFKLMSLHMAAILLSIALFTGLVSGLFPALYLASSTPLNVLKGKRNSGNSYSVVRQGMIVFQFTIPVALIICMMIIKTQDRFMRNYDVGVDKDRLIVLNNSEQLQKHAESFKADLLKNPEFAAVSYSNCIPSRGTRVTNEVSWGGKDDADELHFWCINTDFDYNKVVNLSFTDGRFFDPAFASDSVSYIINDVAADVMKMKDPVGTSITLEGHKGTIIGVINKFHALDLSGPFTPVIMRISQADLSFILIRYTSGSYPTVVNNIKKIYSRYCPDLPFEAMLFRDLRSYKNLALPSNLIGIAFVIALLLACMGLYGLASFTAESRTKEIGIRKTNGSTTFSIMRLLMSNYFKWLAFSFVLAVPIAWLLGSIFQSGFYFHSPLPLWAFIAGPLIAFIVAMLTVSSQTWGVANRNPVDALRYE